MVMCTAVFVEMVMTMRVFMGMSMLVDVFVGMSYAVVGVFVGMPVNMLMAVIFVVGMGMYVFVIVHSILLL